MYQRRRGDLGIFLLLAQVLNMGMNNIPPVTLALVAAQTLIYMGFLPQYFYSSTSVCMSTFLVWYKKDWRRLFLSQFFHADDFHLYFNMSSLLVKGRSLEKRFGSAYFLWMVVVFTALTGVGYVGLNMLLADKLSDDSYATQCAVGFSGVLFALKVVTTHYMPGGFYYALGFIPVPSRYIFWVELLLIQMITPNASFTGHLAGILVGLLYVKGPLKLIMKAFLVPSSASKFHGGGRSSGYRTGWFSSSGSSGDRSTTFPSAPYPQENHFQHPPAYDQYTGGLSEDEQLQQAIQNSHQGLNHVPLQPPPPGLYPDLEELRARRAQRYQ